MSFFCLKVASPTTPVPEVVPVFGLPDCGLGMSPGGSGHWAAIGQVLGASKVSDFTCSHFFLEIFQNFGKFLNLFFFANLARTWTAAVLCRQTMDS